MVSILGHFHLRQLGATASANATTNHKTGDDGTRFAHNREHDGGREPRSGSKSSQAETSLQPEHNSRGGARQSNQRQRLRCNLIELSKQLTELNRRSNRGPHNPPEEYAEIAEPLAKLADRAGGDDREGAGRSRF